MFAYGIKLLPTMKCAVILDNEGQSTNKFINLNIAADIINQKTNNKERRWIAYYDDYNVFSQVIGRTIWFDRFNPLYIPQRYLIHQYLMMS